MEILHNQMNTDHTQTLGHVSKYTGFPFSNEKKKKKL